MNILESIKARKINYVANHFNMFNDGKNLKKLKGIHKGERCFVVGNGPSLKATDLDNIQTHNDISFAFNRIYHIFNQTEWRPTYYISQDQKMLAGCKDEVDKINASMKFVPAEIGWYENIYLTKIHPFHIVNRNIGEYPDFSEDISKEVINSLTVVYTAIQFAVYMGIKEIYLIGVDHHFHTSMNSKGEIVVDPNVKDYFSEKYNTDKENLYIPNTDKSTLTYIAAKRYADSHDIKIYNATRGGKLEVFQRVDFDSLFQKI